MLVRGGGGHGGDLHAGVPQGAEQRAQTRLIQREAAHDGTLRPIADLQRPEPAVQFVAQPGGQHAIDLDAAVSLHGIVLTGFRAVARRVPAAAGGAKLSQSIRSARVAVTTPGEDPPGVVRTRGGSIAPDW